MLQPIGSRSAMAGYCWSLWRSRRHHRYRTIERIELLYGPSWPLWRLSTCQARSGIREVKTKHTLPVLDIAYRSRQISFRRLSHEQCEIQEEVASRKQAGEIVDDDYVSSHIANLEKEASRQEKDALAMYSMPEGTGPSVAPLRRALAVWGLTADDVGVLSTRVTHAKGGSAGKSRAC
jgi:hypothetical protein